jgi:MOSC N-terminal beta barrel domain
MRRMRCGRPRVAGEADRRDPVDRLCRGRRTLGDRWLRGHAPQDGRLRASGERRRPSRRAHGAGVSQRLRPTRQSGVSRRRRGTTRSACPSRADRASVRPCAAVVSQLWRDPVKSFRGERLKEVSVDRRGVVGDRAFAVRDANGKFGSGKTTRRFRLLRDLFDFSAAIDGDAVVVWAPGGRSFRAGDADLDAFLSARYASHLAFCRKEPSRISTLGRCPRARPSAIPRATERDDARRLRERKIAGDDQGRRPSLVRKSLTRPRPTGEAEEKRISLAGEVQERE